RAREITLGYGGGDLRDRAHLTGEIGRHRVHVVREVLPGPGYPRHPRLASELALGAHLARHPRHLRREAPQPIHHVVDRALELHEPSAPVFRALPRQITPGYRRGDLRDRAHLTGEIGRHRVHVVREVLPDPGYPRHPRLASELALGAHLAH